VCGGFEQFPHPRGLLGSGNDDHALPHRYPLSSCTPKIRECEPGSTLRLALETRVLDGRAMGRGRVRPLASFPDMYPGTAQKKQGKWPGKRFSAAARVLDFFVCLSQSFPPALEVMGNLD
jgi:hypothetical protein